MPSEDRAAIEERLREIRNRLSEQGGASFPTASEHGGMLAEQERLQARLRQLKAGGLIANPKPGGVLPLPRRGSGTGGPIPPGPDAVAEGPPRPSRRPWTPGGIMGGGHVGRSPGSALAGLAGSAGVAGPGGPVGERGPVGGSEIDLSGFAGVLPQDPSGFFGDMGALSEPPLPALPTGRPDQLEPAYTGEYPNPVYRPSPSSTGVGIPGAGAMPPPATPGPWGPGRLLPTPPGFDPNANTQKAPGPSRVDLPRDYMDMANELGRESQPSPPLAPSLPSPPSQVGGTIQYGPIGGPPGPKEPLMVSEITPEEFHRGGPPLGPTPSPSPRDFGTGYNQAEFDLPYGTWPSSVTGKGGTQMYLDPLPPPGPIKDYAPGTIPPPPSPETGSPVPGQPTPNNPFGFGPSSQGPIDNIPPYGGPNYFRPPSTSMNMGLGEPNYVESSPAPPALAGLARQSNALPRTQGPLRAGSYRVGGLT